MIESKCRLCGRGHFQGKNDGSEDQGTGKQGSVYRKQRAGCWVYERRALWKVRLEYHLQLDDSDHEQRSKMPGYCSAGDGEIHEIGLRGKVMAICTLLGFFSLMSLCLRDHAIWRTLSGLLSHFIPLMVSGKPRLTHFQKGTLCSLTLLRHHT